MSESSTELGKVKEEPDESSIKESESKNTDTGGTAFGDLLR